MGRARSEGTLAIADALAASLRSGVLSGALAPGTHLRETALAAQHGVARHTVRAAIASLVRAGLVVHEANRGACVLVPEARSGEDLFCFRRVLELGALREALALGSPFAECSEALARLGELVSDTSWDVVTIAHAEIHRGIVAAARSDRLLTAYEPLVDELQLFLTTVRPAYTVPSLVASHRRLLAELGSGDPARAVAALERDLAEGLDALRGTAERQRGSTGSPSRRAHRSGRCRPILRRSTTSTRRARPPDGGAADARIVPQSGGVPMYDRFDVLTFDCYGTLIDWEAGLEHALRVALGNAVDGIDGSRLVTLFGRHEHDAELPGTLYRDVLATTLRAIASDLGTSVDDERAAVFGGSVVDWPAFADSAEALRRLQTRFRLAVITNCDDDLFARSEERLGISFDDVITAEQVGSYKPDLRNFHVAHERIGVPRERILHVAQSLFHDHVPAKSLGMTTVWINRRAGRAAGVGASPQAEATPDLTFPDMASFADAATARR